MHILQGPFRFFCSSYKMFFRFTRIVDKFESNSHTCPVVMSPEPKTTTTKKIHLACFIIFATISSCYQQLWTGTLDSFYLVQSLLSLIHRNILQTSQTTSAWESWWEGISRCDGIGKLICSYLLPVLLESMTSWNRRIQFAPWIETEQFCEACT